MSLNEVRKIAVLRPNAVGDFMFVLPGLHALKHRFPDAELVLFGKPWHAGFLRGRPGPVDRVAVVPPVPGVGAPVGAACDEREVDRFVDVMRAERFDIARPRWSAGCRTANRITAGWRCWKLQAWSMLGRGRRRCFRCLHCRN